MVVAVLGMCQLDSVAPAVERVGGGFLIGDRVTHYYNIIITHGSGRGAMVAMFAVHGRRGVGPVESV